MPIIETKDLPVLEKRPGWRGRVFHSANMTFAHWGFTGGSTIHEHVHEQEEVWHVLEGVLEVSIDGRAHRAGPGCIAIVPAGARHAVLAIESGKAIVCDFPLRPDF